MTAASFHEPPLESALTPLQVFVHRPGGGGGGVRGGFGLRSPAPRPLDPRLQIQLQAKEYRVTPDVYLGCALQDAPQEEVERVLDDLGWKGGIRKTWLEAYRGNRVALEVAKSSVALVSEETLKAIEDRVDGKGIAISDRLEAVRQIVLLACPGTAERLREAIFNTVSLPWEEGCLIRAAIGRALEILEPEWGSRMREDWFHCYAKLR